MTATNRTKWKENIVDKPQRRLFSHHDPRLLKPFRKKIGALAHRRTPSLGTTMVQKQGTGTIFEGAVGYSRDQQAVFEEALRWHC
jgi:hypothetical protein